MNRFNVFLYYFWIRWLLCGELVSAWLCACVSPYAIDNDADTTIQAWGSTEHAAYYDDNHDK